jgi:hypothetical protein
LEARNVAQRVAALKVRLPAQELSLTAGSSAQALQGFTEPMGTHQILSGLGGGRYGDCGENPRGCK